MDNLAPQCREAILEIKPYVPGKPIEEVQRELGIQDVVKLASNENPLGPSPEAVLALREAVEKIHFYPDGTCYYLKEALAAKLGVTPDKLIIGNGTDEILKLLAEAFVNPGEEIVVADPTFSEYEFAAQVMGGRAIKVPCRDFRHDLTAMAEAITSRTRLVFICNPNNPTGTIVEQDELDAFLAKVPTNVLVVIDEAYNEYVTSPAYPDSLAYVRSGRPNVIVLRTFSKIYGLAGLRVGYGISQPEIIHALNRVREPFNVNFLAQVAATAALKDEIHVAKSREINREGKEFLYRELEALGLQFIPTEANFIFVDVGRDSREVFNRLLRKGVIVRTGDIFGYPTFLRITIGTPRQNQRLIASLREVLS
ncbi:histidinol phosphate aminotransferase apoenzyme [Thermanaeromonas toyohensis ToBE]|uniref:Histidinol-phosphate aminotransferase n=1 Tax=Thermanaeromonas toyohensis ToBE TaxID=698762 RepID=A0A1W1VGR1_9FIRM|nr:histidinol-phosphate transaminase [Thermanaeromonas toyohensis]SMB92567.1 histidinol phosphate aminotransferase apoenzyme [Thermanaeromonas toyohensis ToBE]